MRWFLLALLALMASVVATAAPPTLAHRVEFVVRPAQTLQTMVGFGAGFNQRAEDLMNTIKVADRGHAYELLYGEPGTRGAGASLNIVRLTVPPNAEFLANSHSGDAVRYDWAHNDGMTQEWTALQPVFALTRPILYAVPFTPPQRWKVMVTGKGAGWHLASTHYGEYAEYLADYLAYWRGVLGHNIDFLSMQNEPGVTAAWDYCLWTPGEMHDFLPVLAKTLQKRGLDTKLILSEGTNWSGAWSHLEPSLTDPATEKRVAVMASHSYQVNPNDPFADPGRATFAQASVQYGKPVWMSEMSLMQPHQNDDPSMTAALKIARYMHLDITQARASAWIYCFAIFWTVPPGMSEQLGSMGVLSPSDGAAHGALVVPKRLWAVAHYSRFVRTGYKQIVIEGPPFENTGFVSPDGKQLVIVAVNPFDWPVSAHYRVGGSSVQALKAYGTTDTQNMADVAVPVTEANGFTAELPPRSILTITGSLGP